MEEQIRKILDNELMGDAGDTERCCEKITAHVFEFIQWLMLNAMSATTYSLMFYKITNHKPDTSKEWHIEELYRYWKDNVKYI